MRITARIAAGGDRAYSRIPLPRSQMADCLGADGKLDRVKAMLAFAPDEGSDYNPFTHSDGDDETVYFAAMTFSEILRSAMDEATADPSRDIAEGVQTAQDERLVSRMERGRYAIVRNDIRRTAGGVRVRISVGNPLDLVGRSVEEAWGFATTCAQLWLRMAAQIRWLSVECPQRPEVIDDAHRRNRAAELRREYLLCPNRVGGYCSPVKPGCPLWLAGGKCGWKEER